MTVQDPATVPSLLLRLAVEEFLVREAALLDEWRLDEWLELLTEDCRYEVPSTDLPEGRPADSLVLISDNMDRIRGRVTRLKSRRAHREFPSSRTRRLVTNVRVLETTDDAIKVTANFCVYRIRNKVTQFVGRYLFTLVPDGDTFRIRYRRAELDLESLDEHGTVSVIL